MVAKAEFSGPEAVPIRVRDQRIAEVRASQNRGQNKWHKFRSPERPRFQTPLPKDSRGCFRLRASQSPPSPVREDEPRNGRSVDDRPAGSAFGIGTGIGRWAFQARTDRRASARPGSVSGARAFTTSQNEARYPARAIFSDSPFQAPPIEPRRWTNARMGLLTGAVMVICFAVGMIAGRVWMGRWPQGWNLQALTGGTFGGTPAAHLRQLQHRPRPPPRRPPRLRVQQQIPKQIQSESRRNCKGKSRRRWKLSRRASLHSACGCYSCSA